MSGLARLSEERQTMLLSYLLKHTAHARDAQDLVQELYLRLLRTDRSGPADIQSPEAYWSLANRAADHQLIADFGAGQQASMHRDGSLDLIDHHADIGRSTTSLPNDIHFD